MHFSIRQETPESPLSFQLIGDQEEVLLSSGEYNNREACTEAIRATIAAMRDPEAFGIQAENTISLRDPDGSVLATSEPLASRQAATKAIAGIVSAAAQNNQFDVTLTTRTTTTQRRTSPREFQRVSPAELAALYNFARTSSGKIGFELYELDEDQLYYFHFNDADTQPLLFGRGFSAKAKRDRRVEAVIRNAGNQKRYEILQDGSQYYFVLKARNGQEIARSRYFATENETNEAVSFLIGSIPTYADQYIKKRTPRSQATSNIYNLDQPSTSGQRGFEAFRHPENKQHYFHFNDDDGVALLFSQGYSAPKSRDNGIKSVIRNASLAERYEVKEQNGKYYFILRAGNRQEIAQSRFFDSEAERDRWITFMLGTIGGYAGAYGVTLGASRTTTQTESFTLDAPSSAAAAGLAGVAGAMAATGGEADEPAPEEAPEVHDIPAASEVEPADEEPAPDDTILAAPPVEEKVEEEVEEEYAYAGEEERGGFRLWLPWIIGLIALLLLLFWLLSMMDGCGDRGATIVDAETNQQEQIVAAGPEEAQAETTEPTEPEVNDSEGAGGSTGEPPPPLGPAGAALGFAPGSLEARIADMLSDPNRSLPATFVLDKVSFPRHSAKLNKSAYDQVDNLIKLLAAYPNLKINFRGHIDGTEDDNIARRFMNGENITLSAVRARCLYQKFEESGISTSQLDFEGAGASSPVAGNDTEQNKQRNRRLEVIFSAQ